MKPQQKTALITGCGTGLGKALAIALTKKGVRVIGFGRDQKKLETTLAASEEGLFRYFLVDVSDATQVEKTVHEITLSQNIDILINNAAIYPKADFLNQPSSTWHSTIETNLFGVVNSCRAIAPLMINNGFGRIINLGSYAHRQPGENSSAYAVSKAAVHTFTRALACELKHSPADIAICEWIPGPMQTEMGIESGNNPELVAQWISPLLEVMGKDNSGQTYNRNQFEEAPLPFPRRLVQKICFWRR